MSFNLLLRAVTLLLPIPLMVLTITGDNWLLLPTFLSTLNTGRLLLRRYGQKRERRLMIRNSQVVLAITIVIGFISIALQIHFTVSVNTLGVIVILIGVRAFILAILRSSRHSFSVPESIEYPTVTLAIPARNETHALTDTLRAALASDYPKLEILVFDDCSQDSTPEIIKSFAHDGVRFIQGSQPDSGWIGKNAAYEKLLEEASGDIVLFAGVDVHLQPGSVRQLVHLFAGRNLKVLSVMPVRRRFDFWPNLFRPLRYYWQLAFSWRPFISSCWMVDRTWLLTSKGFTPIRHEIRPEHIIAKQAMAHNAYKFAVSSGTAAISTRKRVSSLYETAIRTMYPFLRKEMAFSVLYTLVILTFSLLSVVVWLLEPSVFVTLFQYAIGLIWASYIISEFAQQGLPGIFSGIFFPVNLVSEAISNSLSLLRYELGLVNWKGRNICMTEMDQRPRERE